MIRSRFSGHPRTLPCRQRPVSRIPAGWLFCLILMTGWPSPARAGGQDDDLGFHVRFRDGGRLLTTARDEQIPWKSVSPSGEVTESVVPLSEIRSLSLAETPASVQVARIRQLVTALADNDYHQRNQAERTLVGEGLPFITIIEQFQNHPEPEARYRVARILDSLRHNTDDARAPVVIEFDRLELTDGRTMEGDIGDWQLNGTWLGNPVLVNRANCRWLGQEPLATLDGPVAAGGSPVRVAHVTSPDHFLGEERVPRPGIRFTTFETANNDVTIETGMKEPVEDFFAWLGCLLRCETENGNVVISGYKFKKGLSKKNSVSNLYRDPADGKMKRYSGVMRIEFCLPGQPAIPATVRSAGLGTEIVVPEHTIVQAWNDAGHVVGLTWSTADRNSFIGFDTNTDIAWLTISANEFLVVDKLNRDFAVDDLCFSQPAPLPAINRTPGEQPVWIVTTVNGDRVLCRSLTFAGNGQSITADVVTGQTGTAQIPLADVRWLTGPRTGPPRPASPDGRSVMTRDGSVVHLADRGLTLQDQPGWQLAPDEIIGFWHHREPARYPQPDDFDSGNLVLVRPLHRVALEGNVNWEAGIADLGNLDGIINRQGAGPGQLVESAAATAADFQADGVSPGANSLDAISNLWLAAPTHRAEGTGLLRVADGQQFVLNGQSGFRLQSLAGDNLVLERQGETLAIPLDRVHALQFPAPK